MTIDRDLMKERDSMKENGKADVIVEKKITVYFDDQPEMLKNIPAGVQVMLCRNEGNFNFDEQKWIMSRITGKLV